MVALLTLLVLSGAPKAPPKAPPPGSGPTAADTAKLYFLAGDLPKAQDWVQRGLKREPKTCGPLKKLLAQYAFLASDLDGITPEQAKEFFELDRKISPTVRGKLTEKAWGKYVLKPLELAKARGQGDVPGALDLVGKVLFVDPTNAEALELQKSLSAPDAGR